jgi:hypothetical protein
VEQPGEYEIELRRWPAEADLRITASAPAHQGKLASYVAGKALPIATARLKVAGIDRTQAVAPDDKAAVFHVTLPVGLTTLQTWFYTGAGDELCGAYYVYAKRRSPRRGGRGRRPRGPGPTPRGESGGAKRV